MTAPESPASVLRRAATLIRERAVAVPKGKWGNRPWDVEECSDDGAPSCPCIVFQGEYKPWTEAQVPPIQYVCDAETPEHATWIASMHPAFGLAVADWLEQGAVQYDELTESIYGPAGASFVAGDFGGTVDPALKVARAYLGEGEQ